MIDKINNNRVSDILRDTSARQPSSASSSAESKAAALQVSCESLLQTTQQESLDDPKALERARQLLLSGQLDSPENIRKAAENIVDFGV